MMPLPMLSEEAPSPPVSWWEAWLSAGFRPFFLGAVLLAVISMIVWMAVYVGGWSPSLAGIPSIQWHAHEMLYGFAMAVIAGFLLTAVRRWTHQPTATGRTLLVLFLFWAFARIIALVGTRGWLPLMAALDLLFMAGLSVVIIRPIVHVRQWRQMGILAKLVTLGVGNALFYAGAIGWTAQGMRWGIYLGLYLIVALIMAMGRRIIPPFMTAGIGPSVQPKNRRWVDVGSIVAYLPFMVLEVFTMQKQIAALFAIALLILHGVRLWGWYTPALWRKPLLWSLYLAYAGLVLGFLLYPLSVWGGLSPYLPVHAFAMGGIGLMTLSMMIRVSLGHTGRSVLEPPRAVAIYLVLVGLAVGVRVLLPALWPEPYRLWIALAQILWIIAFGGFFIHFFRVWIHPEQRHRVGLPLMESINAS